MGYTDEQISGRAVLSRKSFAGFWVTKQHCRCRSRISQEVEPASEKPLDEKIGRIHAGFFGTQMSGGRDVL